MKPALQFCFALMALPLLTSCAAAQPPSPFGLLSGSSRQERESPLPQDQPAVPEEAEQGITDFIRNPGFENLDQDQNPADWTGVGKPGIRSEPDGNGGTNHFARVARNHFWAQTTLFPQPLWQSITIGVSVRTDFPQVLPRMDLETKGDPGVLDYTGFSRSEGPGSEWEPFFLSATRIEESNRFGLIPKTRHDAAWADYDDFYFLREGINNGGFEDPVETGRPEIDGWLLANGADRATSAPLSGAASLFLPPGGEASRLVAHSPNAVRYFIAGETDGPLLVEEQRLTSASNPGDGTTSKTVNLGGPGRFLLELSKSSGAEAARLLLRNEGASNVRADSLSRGWAYAWPRVFEPVENSPRPSVRLAAAWPGELESAEIQILDESQALRETLKLEDLQRDETSVWIDYTGAGLEAGGYTARFILSDEAGNQVLLEREFEKVIGPAYPTRPMAVRRLDYTRMPWIFLIPLTPLDEFDSVDEMEAELELARDDGFNFFWLNLAQSQFEMAREAAERVGVPYVVYNPGFASNFENDIGNRTWTPDLVMDELSIFDPFLQSELFQGIYLFDEPNGRSEELVRRVREVMIMMERQDRYPPGYSFLNPNREVAGSDYNLVSSFEYPILRRSWTPRESVEWFVGRLEPHREYATSIRRDYWMGMQGFANYAPHFVPTPHETRAMLGLTLALGSRGYFAFIYDTIGGLSGPRGFQNEEKTRLSAFREFNSRVAAINNTVMMLETERSAPPQQDIIARVARAPNRDVYIYLVNVETEARIRAEMETEEATRLVNVETQDGLSGSPRTTHAIDLAPGDWALLRAEDQVSFTNVAGAVIDDQSPAETAMPDMIATLSAPHTFEYLSLRPDGSYLAGLGNGKLSVLSLLQDTLGRTVHQEDVLARSGGVRYLDNDFLFRGNREFGFRLLEQSGEDFSPVYTFEREFGGGRDILRDGNRLWSAQSFRGVARLDFSSQEDFTRSGQFFGSEFGFQTLAGPFENNALAAFAKVRGLYRLENTPEGLEGERLSGERRNYDKARLSPGGRLAAPALDQGALVIEFTPEGRIAREALIDDPKLVQAQAVAWPSDDTLAVADPRFGVRFYRLYEDGDWERLGLWQPAERPFIIEDLEALPDGTLAVSLLNNQLVLADTTPVILSGRQSGWTLY